MSGEMNYFTAVCPLWVLFLFTFLLKKEAHNNIKSQSWSLNHNSLVVEQTPASDTNVGGQASNSRFGHFNTLEGINLNLFRIALSVFLGIAYFDNFRTRFSCTEFNPPSYQLWPVSLPNNFASITMLKYNVIFSANYACFLLNVSQLFCCVSLRVVVKCKKYFRFSLLKPCFEVYNY